MARKPRAFASMAKSRGEIRGTASNVSAVKIMTSGMRNAPSGFAA
jgi:hypothetical protein